MTSDTRQTVIVYLDNGELRDFAASEDEFLRGFSYEWEGEGVCHLHTRPLAHAFGRVGNVLFCRSLPDHREDCDFLVVLPEEGSPTVFRNGDPSSSPLEVALIPAREELFSRSKGILEVGALAGKKVMIAGLGSFGSRIAIELAKAGVGHFVLFDFDRVELHNLSRHTCTLNDLGRLKTDAIRDAIKGKNPYAEVECHTVDLNDTPDLLQSAVGSVDIVICATDNNQSRFNISKALNGAGVTGIFGRAVTRAEGGDVFISRPGQACYCCLIGNSWFGSQDEEITDEASARRSGRIASYVSQEDAEAVVQVGLSSDIEPITNLMIKLALVELSRGLDTGISSLEEELVYNYYMWANRRERRHANWAPLPAAGARPTILRWYGAHIQCDPSCVVCGSRLTLETDIDRADLELLSRLSEIGTSTADDNEDGPQTNQHA